MISVVVPTYNEGSAPLRLERQLADVRGVQETVFVDASDDPESRVVLSRIEDNGKSRVIRCDKKGRAAQMNQGATLCDGDILLFLHCDTRLPPNAGILVAEALRDGCWGRFDLRLDATGWQFRVIEFMINLRSRVTRIATGDQAIFIRRRAFLEQAGFAEIALMEDIEFSRRLGASDRPALISTPVTTSARRWIGNGTLRTILLMWKLRILYRLGVDPERLARMYRSAR